MSRIIISSLRNFLWRKHFLIPRRWQNMNHCSIPVRRSLYLLFGSFLFGQCSIIFFFQCGMIFSCQTVWSSKSVNNYMLVDADFVTSLNYWWSPWKSYLKIWNTPEVSVLKHQSKGNQRSIRSCYYDWHMLIYCMHAPVARDSTNHESGFVLFIPLPSTILETRKTRSKAKNSRDQCSFLGVILIEVMDPDNGLASERGYDTR